MSTSSKQISEYLTKPKDFPPEFLWWLRRLIEEPGAAGIRFDVDNVGGWLNIRTRGTHPKTGDSFDLDTSNGDAFWQISSLFVLSTVDGNIQFNNQQVTGNMTFATSGIMSQSGGPWEVTAAGDYELRLNTVPGYPYSYHIIGEGVNRIFEVVATYFSDGPDKIGVFNHAPAPQQTGVPVTAAGIHAALVAYGWITA